MGFEYLDNESEKVLQKMIYGHIDEEYPHSIVEHLVNCKYIQADELETGSGDNLFFNIIVVQKGKTYFEMKKKTDEQQILRSNYNMSFEDRKSVV